MDEYLLCLLATLLVLSVWGVQHPTVGREIGTGVKCKINNRNLQLFRKKKKKTYFVTDTWYSTWYTSSTDSTVVQQ